MAKQKSIEQDGTITEALGNANFRVELENGHEVIAHISGKMSLVYSKDESGCTVTRIEAEEIFTTCVAIANVLRKDVRQLCRDRGMPEALIEELVRRNNARRTVYDRFFRQHDANGDLKLSEEEIVRKLRNFGIEAVLDREGNRWIRVPKGRDQMNTVEVNLCSALISRYNYQYL